MNDLIARLERVSAFDCAMDPNPIVDVCEEAATALRAAEARVGELEGAVANLDAIQMEELALIQVARDCERKEAEARVATLEGQVSAYAHAANEWADMATAGIQWLRNIRDNLSNVPDALENMDRCLEHCQKVSREAAVLAKLEGETP